MSKKPGSPKNFSGCGCVVIVALLGGIYVLFSGAGRDRDPATGAASPATSVPVFELGGTVVVGPGHGAWFATTDDAYTEMIDAQNAKSGPLLGRLVETGKAFREPDGAKLLVVRRSFGSLFCRVIEGANVGSEGWVQKEMVQPAK